MKKENFSIVQPRDKYVPSCIEVVRTGGNYVYWGNDNKFSQYLWNLYLKSPILGSIINGTADFIMGNGLTVNGFDKDRISEDGNTLEDTIKKLAIDYLIFGGFAVKVCLNFNHQVADIHWVDIQNIRVNEEETVAYYYPKGFKRLDLEEKYPIYDSTVEYPTYIFYYKGHISRGHYPIPRYIGALQAIETSTEISKFHLRNIRNNFASSYIVNYNNADFTEEEKAEIKNGLRDNFSGADNAGNFMLAFNESKENAVSIEQIPENEFDKKFEALKESTMKDIFVAFRCSQQLFGFTTEGTAFNSQEFDEAFKLYNKTCVVPMQDDITRAFNKILGLENSLTFDTFTL